MAKQTIGIGTVANDNMGDPLRDAMDKINDNFNELYPLKTGVFNILDYGAVSDDDIDDSTAINDAITAAEAYASTYFGNGVVYIPSGSYTLSGAIELKSNVNIQIANNTYFNVGSYSGSIFHSSNQILRDAWISGGVFYSSARLYTGIEIENTISVTDSYTAYCHFENMVFYGCNKGISFVTSNYGWVNANVFQNITLRDFVIGIEAVKGTNGSVSGNIFNNIIMQTSANTTHGLKDFDGARNSFTDLWIWDLPATGVGVSLVGSLNTFYGGYIPSTNFSDTSRQGNTIKTSNEWICRETSGIEMKKFEIAHSGDTNADFKFTSVANEDRQDILVTTIPANSRILGIEIVCRIPANYPGVNPVMNWTVGNVSGGDQFIQSKSCSTYLKAINITDANRPLAMGISYLSATEIWVGVDIVSTLWSNLTQGAWDIFISYIRYPFD